MYGKISAIKLKAFAPYHVASHFTLCRSVPGLILRIRALRPIGQRRTAFSTTSRSVIASRTLKKPCHEPV